jgi:allantoate deiminase
MSSGARKIMARIDALGAVSDEHGRLTRTYGSPAMRRANALVARWMREAGMRTRVDPIGNLLGFYPGSRSGSKTLLLGSHLDTVPNAGKFDGVLGVLLAIACVERLHRSKIRLPFAIGVIGFADEEGVRYRTTYLGSRALAGTLRPKDLNRKDAHGISLRDAIQAFGGSHARLRQARIAPRTLLGYLEAHIEQGPVLERMNLSTAVVTGIAGQTRARVHFTGRAGHAGTTPMQLRRDALCAAAEFILAMESLARRQPGLAATAGEITVQPGAGNVIPGSASISLDLRHARDSMRQSALKTLKARAGRIARRRHLQSRFDTIQETQGVALSSQLTTLLSRALKRHQKKLVQLPSGAGHDAAIMAGITPSAMLFIRCKGGISHEPRESASLRDIQLAFNVLNDFLLLLAS